MNRAVFVLVALLCLLSASSITGSIQIVRADGGTITINADGSITPSNAPIYSTDNITYTLTGNITANADGIVIERNNTVLNGAGYTATGSGSGNGITLTSQSNVTVRNISIGNFYHGIYLSSSSNSTLFGNNLANNVWGVDLDSSSSNVCSSNNVTANSEDGIEFGDYSSNNVFSSNNIANNLNGISLYASSGNTLSGNNVTANKLDGIYLTSSSSDNVLSGNNVTANKQDGIWLFISSGNILSGNTVTANKANGIELVSSPNSTLSSNNVAANNGDGIEVSSDNNVLSRNKVTANNDYGINLDYSLGNILSGNEMESNRYNFRVEGFPQSVDTSNLVEGKPVYYLVNQSDIVVDPDAYPEVGYLGFVNCVNVTVQGMNLTNNGQGLLLAHTKDSKITGNSVANNKLGIDLESSSGNVLSGNNVTNNYVGQTAILLTDSCNNNTISGNALTDVTGNGGCISIWHSSNDNTLIGNVVTANVRGVGTGILLGVSCNNNTISDNSVARTGQGISLEDSSNSNSISGNNVTSNKFDGISLDSCDSNDVSGNNITANQNYGVSLGHSSNNTLSGNNVANNLWGIYLDSSSNNNTIYHNNFVNNTSQIAPVFSFGGTNVWDYGYPSGGNYWSDYNSTDLKSGQYQNMTGSDGIGDVPYVVDANNTDYFPLMGIFSSFSTLTGYPVNIISNSTISGFVAPIWLEHLETVTLTFSVKGENGSTGFCRVSFPTTIMNGTYHVSVNGIEVPYILLPCSNANSSYLYFTYKHSTEQVIILPEFPSFLILSLFMIAALLAVIFYKRNMYRFQGLHRSAQTGSLLNILSYGRSLA